MKKIYIIISLFICLLIGCKEDNLHIPYGYNDGLVQHRFFHIQDFTPQR